MKEGKICLRLKKGKGKGNYKVKILAHTRIGFCIARKVFHNMGDLPFKYY